MSIETMNSSAPFRQEMWRPIRGYESSYQVSTLGRVKSVRREVIDRKCRRTFPEKILNPTMSDGKQPYYYVSLSKEGRVKKRMVHRLVAETFIANPLEKEQVNHKNGNVLDNRVCNLEWVTNAENTQHAYDNWLNKTGQMKISFGGRTQNLKKWCEELRLPYKRIYNRIKYLGWSIEEAFSYDKGVWHNHVGN